MVFSASQSQGAVGDTFKENEDDHIQYTVLTEEGNSGTVEVGYADKYRLEGDVIIPSTATNKDTGITYRVTAIREDGFHGCDNMTSIEIPDSVTTIGKKAFSNADGITSIEIPDSVTTVGPSAFWYCSNLQSVVIPGSVGVIPSELFRSCEALTNVVIGNGVTHIGYYAFAFCYALTSVTIPDSVTWIGNYAFDYTALESIVIPAGVDTLGKSVFEDCANLTSVYFMGDVPADTGWTIYWGTPETLLTYYPVGNASWEAEIVDGMWRDRGVANWTPAPPQPEDPPKIEYVISNKELILNFTGELYESDDAVNWTKVESAVSPYKVKMGDRKQFFCVKEASSVPEDQVLPGENAVISLPGNVDLDINWIKPGTFMMGSPKNELGRENKETQHQVTLTKGYWLGKYEVTQAQYKAVTGTNPSWDKGADLPVEQVTWNDAMKFCSKLTDIEREAGRLPEGYEYTLPTEAQWEYACRAGTTTALNSGKNLSDEYQCPEMDEVGWYWYNGGKESYNNNLICTHSGGQKKPNAWGLYDMHGNVGEWCLDWYEDYPTTAVVDPTGPDTGTDRAVRWGSWWNAAWACRSAYRGNDKPNAVYASLGFRVALAPVVIPDGGDMTIPISDDVSLDMIWIEPGTFMMGSPKNELGRENNETQHQVTLTKGYWLGKYEVTQKQYQAIMGTNPSKWKGADLPVEQVTWRNATNFCAKLTEIERAAGRLPAGYEYTLPTEAQWEYACRAGTTTALNSGKDLSDWHECPEMDEVAWYHYNSNKTTHPVGQKKPNAWGLYDMHGNVWEWCLDWEGNYPSSAVTDPVGPSTGTSRVFRGGSWDYYATHCRSARRVGNYPGDGWEDNGFRVALAPVK